jgi:nucleoside-diphosphate-sugar epimerase
MTVVAVAGGSGKLGRAIVDGIVAAGKFEVVIMAREVCVSSSSCYFILNLSFPRFAD